MVSPKPDDTAPTGASRTASPRVALVRSAHPGPVIAVSALAAGLAVSAGLTPGRIALVTAAVACGQLSIGWSNDLIDRGRDREVRRADKPLATGELTVTLARRACGIALAATVVLSLLCGVVAGLIHLGSVAAGWTYNLGLKSTALSWLPYALAFGALQIFVVMAEPGAGLPAPWLPLAGALLGVGAHLVNTLPDLVDDEATGVRGLPHRIGPTRSRLLAVTVLCAATVVIALGAGSVPRWLMIPVLGAVAALAVVALVAEGRTPFRAAIAIALADAVLLVAAR